MIGEKAQREFERRLQERGPLALKRRLEVEVEELWRLRVRPGQPTEAAS